MTAPVTVSSLVLFADDLARTAAFYRAVGVDLEHEDHGDGPAHWAAELAGVHFAIYPAPEDPGRRARPWRSAGSDFPGFYVASLDAVTAALDAAGTRILQAHQAVPWGCRVVAEDPDGRAVEINDKAHCADRS